MAKKMPKKKVGAMRSMKKKAPPFAKKTATNESGMAKKPMAEMPPDPKGKPAPGARMPKKPRKTGRRPRNAGRS